MRKREEERDREKREIKGGRLKSKRGEKEGGGTGGSFPFGRFIVRMEASGCCKLRELPTRESTRSIRLVYNFLVVDDGLFSWVTTSFVFANVPKRSPVREKKICRYLCLSVLFQ